MRENGIDYYLCDDGTLDTVVLVCCGDDEQELSYDMECAAEYRDENGYLDFTHFVSDIVMPDAEEEFADDRL